MEDDPNIDIEENTFMYPRIENIYSDVNIKTEPIDVDEDEYELIGVEDSSNEYYMQIPSKIILGSKPATLLVSEPTAGPSAASDWEDQENFFECVECNLLFPTQNELDSHKTASHSYLVARPMSRAIKTERRISISSTNSCSFLEDTSSQQETKRRQKAVKSTSKSALNKTFPILSIALKNGNNNPYRDIDVSVSENEDSTDDKLLCKHCNIRFPDEIALIKHTYELLPETKFDCDMCQASFDSKPSLKGHRAGHFKKMGTPSPPKDSEKMLQCIYCTCFLIYPGYMKKHLLNNHKTTEFAVKHAKFTGKCVYCPKAFGTYKNYNNHLLKYHRKIFMSKTAHNTDDAPAKFKCSLCSQIFPSRYSAYKHKTAKHQEYNHKQVFYKIYDKPIKELPENPQTAKLKQQTPKSLLGNMSYIPKQNLFKCNKCQIHFVSCSAAFAHSKRCSLAKGDWKCNKCRRTFTKAERSAHTQQHEFSEKFKVHIVCDKILSKVLCRCPKCELFFDEIAFTEHVSTECVSTSGVQCKDCDFKIHSDSYAKHRRYHNKYNFTSGDFILIDFVDASFQNAPSTEETKYKRKLLYCINCTCHFYAITSKFKHHLERKCLTLERKCCTICGLAFSKKPYITHMNFDHETIQVKLDDIKFQRIQDMKVINPVMPEFFQCEQCEVRFVSQMSKNSHACSKQVFVKCAKCSQKYDSVTYDIHLTFHNYNHAKTEDNDKSSVALTFFACSACNYGFHSYDSMVEHCQKHYINTEEMMVKHCKICKLSYADAHKMKHAKRSNYKIFKFDHEKLLTDDWLLGFEYLPKDAVDEIVSRSVYAGLRNVRLELLVEGPPERTLYKCAQCELNFEQDYVLEHTAETCSSTPRFECSSCIATFRTRIAKNNHMNVHVIYGDDITFREIVFNHQNDKELNEALRTGRQKESLKFRKCQQCKKLIKKSDYEAHVAAHEKKMEIKVFKFPKLNKSITYKLLKPVHAAKKLYTVYKCMSCSGCVMKKVNVIRHKCGTPEKYEKCSKCSLSFLACNLRRHIEQHALIPKFNTKNILVLEFQLLDNGDNLAKKRRRYSFDDDASTEVGNVNMKKAVPKTYDTRKVKGKPYSDNLSEDSQDNSLDDASTDASVTSNVYAKKYIKKNCIEKNQNDNKIVESPNKVECSPEKRNDISKSIIDAENLRIEMKHRLYQCNRCFLCFRNRQSLINHVLECDDRSLSETPLACNLCDMVFHPSLITFHRKLHEIAAENPIENYIYLINVSTNGVNVDNELQWLNRCGLCDVHYLSLRSLEHHFTNDHALTECLNCETCGLKFTKHSRTRHIRIQHEEGGWSKDYIHIETTEKKIINLGQICLTAYVNAHSRNNEGSFINQRRSKDDGKSTNITLAKEDSTEIDKSASVKTEHFNETSNNTSCETSVDEIVMKNNIDLLKDENEEISRILYKCDICSKHYLTKFTFARHIINESHKDNSHKCDICGLYFGKRILTIHKSIQHKKLNLSREDFIITKLKLAENDVKKEEVVSGVLSNQIENSDTSIDGISALSKSENVGVLDKKKNKLKASSSVPIDNHVYKCVECSVFYTNRHTLLLHIVIRKHNQTEYLRCDICGLLFGKGSLQKHKDIQHEKLKLSRKDFIITDVFGAQLPDEDDNDKNSLKGAPSLVTDDRPLTGLDVKDNEKEKTELKMFRLYQCKDCRVCVQKSERKLHVCCSDIQKKRCIKCCLSFRNTDVVSHKRLHRKHRELSRKNFTLIRFGRRAAKNHKIYKCVSCSTHFVSLNALEWHINTLKHHSKRDDCKSCGLYFGRYCLNRHIYIHHKRLNLSVDQFNIIYVSDDDKSTRNIETKESEMKGLNNSTSKTISELEAASNVKTVKKLFKCGECDVYFPTRASYYNHIYKHRKLDATEYIDCNICDFQFLNEFLGVHMKTHKDKSFCLDKLLIEQYQPNSIEGPKVESYFARDNLNSKLVSTTTPFDNDDEVLGRTDEQLSVIDSTSDEIPKAKADQTINETSSYPHNSNSSREEGTFNSILESPNADVSDKLKE